MYFKRCNRCNDPIVLSNCKKILNTKRLICILITTQIYEKKFRISKKLKCIKPIKIIYFGEVYILTKPKFSKLIGCNLPADNFNGVIVFNIMILSDM